MPHRHAEFVARCDACQEPATAACLRCERPTCDQHAPTDLARCAACEEEWQRRAIELPAPDRDPVDDITPYVRWAVLPTLALTVLAAIAVSIATGAIATGLILGMLIGAVVSVPLFGVVSAALLGVRVKRSLEPIHARLQTRTSRRAFLRERAPRRALPAPGFGEEE